jgi:hypothetical protein
MDPVNICSALSFRRDEESPEDIPIPKLAALFPFGQLLSGRMRVEKKLWTKGKCNNRDVNSLPEMKA